MRPVLHLCSVLSLLLAACAPASVGPPSPAPAPVAAAGDAAPGPAAYPLLRELPQPAHYREALERGTRSATGAPGPRYWQQRVSYRIEAELDPETALLRGAERIVYRNQSPDTLREIVLNLYQNVFSEGVPRNRSVRVTGGVALERVAAQGRTLSAGRGSGAGYSVQGTLGRVRLPRPLAPGDSATLEIEWRYTVPPAGTFRTAWEDALGGRAFQVAQWYPQVATYDDLRGWDATPYLGDGEFYLEYGDFDVSITVPEGFLVGATGVLQNPEEVLTAEARERLAHALRSDSVTAVVTEADLEAQNATQRAQDGQLTWRFRAEDVRDFGFATSNRYVWDATRAGIGGEGGRERQVAVHALYRPGAPHWERAARFAQHSTEFFSDALIPYLYPQVTVAEGPVGGMEYPQLVFIGKPSTAAALHSVIAHEVGHEWFPMMVGSDEASFAWMDEGVTTFYEGLAKSDFHGQPDTVSFAGDLGSYLRVAGTESEVPLARHTDLVSPYGARGVAAYTKPGVLLRSLRAVLGEEVFDRAMRTYAREWLLKHPAPHDLFATLERVSGRELDWFLYPWWYETGTLDQAIAEVRPAGGEVTVVVRDQGDIPMPTPVVVTTAGGATHRTEIPVERWLRGTRTAEASLRVQGEVVRVELDPERLFPDVDREDNVWTAPGG